MKSNAKNEAKPSELDLLGLEESLTMECAGLRQRLGMCMALPDSLAKTDLVKRVELLQCHRDSLVQQSEERGIRWQKRTETVALPTAASTTAAAPSTAGGLGEQLLAGVQSCETASDRARFIREHEQELKSLGIAFIK